jgi:hypothetical protein
MARVYDPEYEYKHLQQDLLELQMPLSILQLDPADRAVLRIAGKLINFDYARLGLRGKR